MSGRIPARAISASTATPSSRPTSSRRPTRSAGRPASISSSRNSRRCCAAPWRGTAMSRCCSRMSSSTLPTWATASPSRSGIWRRRRPARSMRDISWPVTAPTASCAESSGSAIEDLAFDEWWIVVDAWQRRPTALPEMNTQYCWPSRPASAIAGPRNLRRWELKILPHEKPEEFQDDARVREVLAGFVDIDAIELWRSAVYRFHALVAAQWNRNRIFLLGDCAHQMPPFLGQGMCAGIRDAANLIWKLLLVEKSGVSRTVLSTYQDERKTHVQNVVAQAKELGLVIGELDVEAATARDARLRAERISGEPARHRLIPPLTRGLIDRDHRGGADEARPARCFPSRGSQQRTGGSRCWTTSFRPRSSSSPARWMPKRRWANGRRRYPAPARCGSCRAARRPRRDRRC